MRMMRSLSALAAVAALSALAVAAYAQPPVPTALHEESEAKFPMTAGEYRGRVNRRVEEFRLRMEERMADKQLPADQREEHRARFRSGVAQLNTKVDEVCADGTVTKEEALAVHELAKSLLHYHHPQG
jgi:hypothetical protein